MTAAPLFLTLCSAVLYVLSFPPFALFPLIWVALVPFFLTASTVRPSSAAAYGLLWGALMTYGFGWSFAPMVVNYFGVSPAIGVIALFAVSIVLFGIYFSAFAAWLSWLAHRQAASPLLIAAGWGVCEFARANLGIGNPLALVSYSQTRLTYLMQIADVTGPYGVGILVAAANACLAGFFAPALRGRRPVPSPAGVVILFGLTLGYGHWRLSQTFAAGEPVQVAVVQGGIERQFRWDPAYRDANLAHYLKLTKEAATTQTKLIFWPEHAIDFPLQKETPQTQAVFKATRDLGIELILGGPYYRFGVKDIHNRNAVFLVRGGKLVSRYDKLLLVPFAEDDRFGWLAARNKLGYEPGRRLYLLRASVAQIGVFVCFEVMYPELVRRFARQGAEVLANPSNDNWFGYAAPARHMLDMAIVRAIENRRYLVRPTSTGFSAVIDPHGRTVVLSGFGSPEALTTTIRPSLALTPYLRWGDVVAWTAAAFVAAVTFFHAGWLRQRFQRR
jgi:apolipoprotein N-acyltransferase